MIFQRLWRTGQGDTFERNYTKVPSLFIALTAVFFYLFTRMYMNTRYWSVVSSEPDSVQSCSKTRSTFDVFFAFNFLIISSSYNK